MPFSPPAVHKQVGDDAIFLKPPMLSKSPSKGTTADNDLLHGTANTAEPHDSESNTSDSSDTYSESMSESRETLLRDFGGQFQDINTCVKQSPFDLGAFQMMTYLFSVVMKLSRATEDPSHAATGYFRDWERADKLSKDHPAEIVLPQNFVPRSRTGTYEDMLKRDLIAAMGSPLDKMDYDASGGEPEGDQGAKLPTHRAPDRDEDSVSMSSYSWQTANTENPEQSQAQAVSWALEEFGPDVPSSPTCSDNSGVLPDPNIDCAMVSDSAMVFDSIDYCVLPEDGSGSRPVSAEYQEAVAGPSNSKGANVKRTRGSSTSKENEGGKDDDDDRLKNKRVKSFNQDYESARRRFACPYHKFDPVGSPFCCRPCPKNPQGGADNFSRIK